MNTTTILLLLVGGVLIAAGIIDKSPIDILKGVVSGTPSKATAAPWPDTSSGGGSWTVDPNAAPPPTSSTPGGITGHSGD